MNNFTGIILAGGRSSRMGENKALIRYHNKEQYLYCADILFNFCEKVYVSSSKYQQMSYNLPVIYDTAQFSDLGPAGALASVFEQISGPFLLFACDYPLIDKAEFAHLISNRNSQKIATCFLNQNNMIEPLISIIENQFNPLLLTYIKSGESSLRKIFENHSHAISPLKPDNLISVDTPQLKNKIISRQHGGTKIN